MDVAEVLIRLSAPVGDGGNKHIAGQEPGPAPAALAAAAAGGRGNTRALDGDEQRLIRADRDLIFLVMDDDLRLEALRAGSRGP